MSEGFETYFLVQRSRTGYVWVTDYATRSRHDAGLRLAARCGDWQHYRILNAKTGVVIKIERPAVSL